MTKIILNFVNTEQNHNTDANNAINKEFPSVEKHYYDYIRSYNKHKMQILSAYQFVPTEVWAEYLFKEIGSKSLSKDYIGTYVVNCFVITVKGKEIYYDFSAIIKCFKEIAEMIKDAFGDDYKLIIYADENFSKVKKFIFGQINKFFGKRCIVNFIISSQNDVIERENDNVNYFDWEDDDVDEGWL